MTRSAAGGGRLAHGWVVPRAKALVQRLERSRFYAGALAPLRAVYRTYGVRHGARALAFLLESEWRARRNAARLTILDEGEIARRRKSDTVFVFGSGASLNGISDAEWERIRRHDAIGLNYFVHQRWVDVTIHYVRELELPLRRHRRYSRGAILATARRFCDLARANPRYRDTVFFLQTDFFAEVGKAIIGWQMLPKGQPVFLYRGLRRPGIEEQPPRSLAEGLPRQAGAIGAGICIGRFLGWRHIVLIGVDLYDSRYFWLPPGEVRSEFTRAARDRHPTVRRGILDIIGNWYRTLEAEGVSLSVYNPQSLLREVLPQFSWEDGQPVQAKAAAAAHPIPEP